VVTAEAPLLDSSLPDSPLVEPVEPVDDSVADVSDDCEPVDSPLELDAADVSLAAGCFAATVDVVEVFFVDSAGSCPDASCT
jgi:hypothetical protein